MSEEEKKEEKIKFKIQGKEYEVDKQAVDKYRYIDDSLNSISFKEPQTISLIIDGIEKEYKQVSYIKFYNHSAEQIISFKEPQTISLIIDDIENSVKTSSITMSVDDSSNWETFSFSIIESQKISFKIGDITNKDIEITEARITQSLYHDKPYYNRNGEKGIENHCSVIYLKESQKISFKIGDVTNEDVEVEAIGLSGLKPNVVDAIYGSKLSISFKIGNELNSNIDAYEVAFINDNIYIAFFDLHQNNRVIFKYRDVDYNYLLRYIQWSNKDGLVKEMGLSWTENVEYKTFYYNEKKYKFNFYAGEKIAFDNLGQLTSETIRRSETRMNQIKEQDKIDDLEDKQSVATGIDWGFVVITGFIGLCCVAVALWLCFGKAVFILHFNKYTFLYEILERTPIIILVILGFKFLQLAFERLRLIGEVEKVQKYINLAKGDDVKNVKNNLLGIIAIPFFAPKKVKSSVFDRLIEKLSIEVDVIPKK